MARGGIKIVVNRFPEIAKQLPDGMRKANIETAENVADDARANAAKDSGSLEASIYVASSEGSGYSDAVAAAKDANEKVEIVPEVTVPSPEAAVVGVAAGHGQFNELGTVNMAAHPFMRPAAKANEAGHLKKVKRVIEEL